MTSYRRRRTLASAAGCLGLAMVLAACMPPDDDGGGDGGGGGGDGGGAAEGCDDYEQFQGFGDVEGTTVNIYTSITEPEDKPHIDSYVQFEECTGIDIVYEGSREFEAQLPVRIQSGQAPDIAFIPQPGLLQTLVRDHGDQIVPAPQAVQDNVAEFYTEEWANYSSVDGTLYAAPLGANVKSFVWYSPSAFADAGYEIPETWDELVALSDQIVADGGVPWCAGLESGEATGWPATDWLEDVLLRTAGPEVYDQWVAHEIPFDDPQVAEALETVGTILKNPDYVNGGFGDVRSIASTPFTDAGFPILDGECWMHRQASFYQANWPEAREGVTVAEDGDVFAFYFPAMSADEQPLLGGGEFVAAFADRPEVNAVRAFLSSPVWSNAMAANHPGGWFSANTGLDVELLRSPIDRLAVELLRDETAVFRFDASDLMPGEVGAAAFWTEMVNWIATDKANDAVLADIEAAWPGG